MIGGQALVSLGSSRQTEDVDYLVKADGMPTFIHDKAANADYINAAGKDTKFFAEVWKMEKSNLGPLASPEALLELKAFAFVQHCVQRHFTKADNDEFDITFLARKYELGVPTIVKKYVSAGQYSEIQAIFNRLRR